MDVSPNATGTPSASSSNGLEVILTHSDGNHYDVNSSYPDIEYSFNREWPGTATSEDGLVKRTDNETQKIKVSDTENPTGTIPADIVLTKEEVTANGELTTSLTGEVTQITDNSQLAVEATVNYELVSENSNQKEYKARHTLEDKLGNIANLAPQKVTVVNATLSIETLSNIIINAKRNQNLSPETLEQQGYNAIPEVTVSNTSSNYTLTYSDTDTTYFSTTYAWGDREFTRTYICSLNTGASSDTTIYKVRVKDLEKPTVANLEAIKITKDKELHPSVTGYPEITDNVAVEDTTITYALISESTTEKKYNAQAKVTDVFGNDTTYSYQEVTVDLVTGIEDEEVLPSEYVLNQNYPNPFNPTTTIQFSVPYNSQSTKAFGTVLRKTVPQTFLSVKNRRTIHSQNVSLKVYDVLGKEVATLVNETKPAGRYSVTFNAEHLPSGVYLYRLQSGEFVETKQMLFLK